MGNEISFSIFMVLVIALSFCSEDTPVFGPAFRERYEDAFLDPSDLIQKYGYTSEEFNVTTEDGYILVVNRIPLKETCENRKGVVIIVHGLALTSTIWLIQGGGRALPFLLADECYDIWLPNLRGNYYSRYHKTLSNKDTRFWEFTLQEVGTYDLPAIISHISDTTGENSFFYIGLSYGNTAFYILMSEKPEYNDKIKLHVSCGPAASIASITGWHWKVGFTIVSYLHPEMELAGVNEIAPKTEANYVFSETTCQPNTPTQEACMAAILWIDGNDKERVNKTLLPVYAGHYPAGVGRNIFIQYGQSVRYKEFRKFDYGPVENEKKYGASDPPGYNWEKITCPVIFYQGDRDSVTTADESKALYDKLPNGIEYKMFETFNHQDFAIGTNSTEIVYEPLIDIIKQY